MGVIYKITSPSGKLYVGKTYDLRKRINSHKCSSKVNKNIILYNSIRKYGWDAHKLEIIEEVDKLLLNEREVFWIKELNSYCYDNANGLNMTKGGEGQSSTWMHKTELRKFFSDKFSGEGNPFYGKKHTKETIQFFSENAKIRNKKEGRVVPKWGAEKGRLKVIKSVISYDSNGNFYKEYESVTNASKDLGLPTSSVSASCRGAQTNSGGYIFKFKTEKYPFKIDVSNVKEKAVKRPIICFFGNNKIEYPSALEASFDLKIPKGTINRAAYYNKGKKIRSGHVFIYKDLVAEILKQTA